MKSGSLIGRKQGPVAVFTNALHAVNEEQCSAVDAKQTKQNHLQEIRDPQCVEQVTSTNFLLSVVLTEIQEFEYVRVPRLEIDSEGTGTLVTTLVNVTSSGVERTKHRHDSVGVAIRACDIGTKAANVSS